MRRILFAMLLVCVIGIVGCTEPAEACGDFCDSKFMEKIDDCVTHPEPPVHNEKLATDTVVGAKADAPNLIKLAKNWTLGVEGGKDLLNTTPDEGWFIFGKITFSGTLFDLTKKE